MRPEYPSLNLSGNASHTAGPNIVNRTMPTVVGALVGPTWNFMSIFYLVAIVCTLITNGTVLLTFLCRKSLRTSFNIYLVNLLIANLLNVVIHDIPNLLGQLYSRWWMGYSYCSLMLFGLYIFNAGIQNCHLLIAINRIWAVFWPYSYRHLHTNRVALLMCLGGWLEVSTMVLPGWFLDILYYRTDPALKSGCNLNATAQWTWAVIVQFLVYNMGLGLMWIAYPVIWWKRRHSLRVSARIGTHHQIVQNTCIAGSSIDINALASALDEGDQPLRPLKARQTDHSTTSAMIMRQQASGFSDSESSSRTRPARKQKASSNAFTVLTVLTSSVTICWTPTCVLYTMMLWVPSEVISPLVLDTAALLFTLQMIMDPLLFVYAIPPLRQALQTLSRNLIIAASERSDHG